MRTSLYGNHLIICLLILLVGLLVQFQQGPGSRQMGAMHQNIVDQLELNEAQKSNLQDEYNRHLKEMI